MMRGEIGRPNRSEGGRRIQRDRSLFPVGCFWFGWRMPHELESELSELSESDEASCSLAGWLGLGALALGLPWHFMHGLQSAGTVSENLYGACAKAQPHRVFHSMLEAWAGLAAAMWYVPRSA